MARTGGSGAWSVWDHLRLNDLRGEPKVASNTPTVKGFTDLRPIGIGGFSEVFSAQQRSVDRTVALKVLKIDALADRADYARRQFAHEVKLMGRLGSHPNLVGVYDAGQTSDKRPWLAMDLFDRSFADVLEQEGVVSPDDAVAVLRAAGSALGMAHHLGQVHRDVKPANLLERKAAHHADLRKIALGDFGIARDVRRLEHTQSLNVLSLLHSAPEVLIGKAPVPESDLYSLGSTVYALLAGRAPFEGPESEDDLAFVHRAVSQDVPSIPRRDLPDGLVQIIETLLAKDVTNRYRTTSDLLLDLDRFEAQTPGERRAAAPTRLTGISSATSRFAPPGDAPEPAPPAPAGSPSPPMSPPVELSGFSLAPGVRAPVDETAHRSMPPLADANSPDAGAAGGGTAAPESPTPAGTVLSGADRTGRGTARTDRSRCRAPRHHRAPRTPPRT